MKLLKGFKSYFNMSIKKCKPTHKRTIGFQSCEDRKEHFKFGLCKDCYKLWLQTEKGKQFIDDMKIKAHVKTEKVLKKEYRKEQKQKKESVKTINQLKGELQNIFNELIRLIDEGKGCISCDHGWNKNFSRQKHAGHYYSRNSQPHLRFHAFNVYLQCQQCNTHKSGNMLMYNSGLIKLYGEDWFNNVRELKQIYSDNIKRSDIPELKKKVRQLIKRVENGEVITRDYINVYLNLY